MESIRVDESTSDAHRVRAHRTRRLDSKRARFAPLLVAVYVMANDSFFFFRSEPLNVFRRVLLILIPVALAMLYGTSALPKFVGRFLAVAYAAFLWATVVTTITGHSFAGPLLLIQNFAPFAFLAAVAAASRYSATRHSIMRAIFWMGAILSVQTTILFLLFLANHLPPSTVVVLSGTRKLNEVDFGVWGYANAVLQRGSGFSVYRAQSWFGEPSNFALFLESSLAFGLLTLPSATRRGVHRAGLIITVVAMVLTFSTALIFTAVAAGAIIAMSRLTKRSDPTTRMAVITLVIVGCLVLVSPAVKVLNDFYGAGHGRLSVAFGKSATSSGTRERASREAIAYVLAHPLGTGFTPLSELRLSHDDVVSEPPGSAPLFWVLTLGLPGAIFVGLLIAGNLFGLVTPALAAGGAAKVLGASLLAQTVHQVSAGSFTAGTFLLTITVLSWEINAVRRTEQHPVWRLGSRPREVTSVKSPSL